MEHGKRDCAAHYRLCQEYGEGRQTQGYMNSERGRLGYNGRSVDFFARYLCRSSPLLFTVSVFASPFCFESWPGVSLTTNSLRFLYIYIPNELFLPLLGVAVASSWAKDSSLVLQSSIVLSFWALSPRYSLFFQSHQLDHQSMRWCANPPIG